jgi:5-methylcytosine-specific restriction protein A
MVSHIQIGLVIIVVIIIIIASNDKYFRTVNKLYDNISKIPKLILIVISLCSLFGLGHLIQDNSVTLPSLPELSSLLPQTDQTKKRNVSESTKKMVAANQKWHCGMCQRLLDETFEVDHIIPLYKGGSNEMSNLMALDPICHRKKTNADRLVIS